MENYGHLTHAELVSLIRELKAARAGDGAASGKPHDFPVFSEWHQREFDKSPWPMRIFDHETFGYLAVNDAALKLYGYTRQEFLALAAIDTRHPDEHAEFRASMQESAGYLRHRGPRRHIKKSGEVVVVEGVMQDIVFNGRLARLAMTIDVTDKIHVQELLWQRQQEFETLAENLPALIARFDRERRYVYANSAVEKLLSTARYDIIGKTLRDLMIPDTLAAQFERSLDEAFRDGESHTLEFSMTTPAGERFFEAYHVPERDGTGQVATVLCVAHDITGLKQSEAELRRQKNLLEAIIDNLPVGVFTRDAKTLRYVIRNRYCERMNGYAVDTSVGKTAYDLFPREQADRATATDRKALETGQMQEVPEQEMLGRSGDPRIYHVRKVPLLGDDGRPWMLLGIAEDVTVRKRAEEALRESEARFELAVENTGLGMWDWNVRTSEVWRHPQWARMLGYEPGEVRGHICMWREFCHPDDWEATHEKLMAHMEGNAPDYAAEYRMRKKDGSWLWVVCRGRVIERDTDDSPLRMIGYIQDISQHKQSEDALRESEERFRQLAENIHQVFWINTPAGDQMDYISPAYEEIWGRSCESLYRDPRSWMESIHPDDLQGVQSSQEAMRRGERTDVEYRIIRSDGTVRWIMDRSYPMIRSDGTRLACGIAEDITDAKLTEQKRLTHAIHQRDALVREVHHRIKNSLQGVAGLLRQRIRKNPAIAPDIEETISQLQSVALVYGLQETRPDGMIVLAEIVEEVCASAEGLTGGQVERSLERKSPRPACVAGSEAVSVAVALNELVFNALKHQAGAGRKRARVTLLESNGTAEIHIANRGRLPKGFDFAGDRVVGHGLGLVRTLLAAPGSDVVFNGGRNEVKVVLKLRPPLLAGRQGARMRRDGNGGAIQERAAAAHTGRGR